MGAFARTAQVPWNRVFRSLGRAFQLELAGRPGKLVDGRQAYITQNGERAWSGKYRRWRRDGILPNDETVQRVLTRTQGAVDLRWWRDLVLWELLTPEPQLLALPEKRMRQFPAHIRDMLFENIAANRSLDRSRLDIGRERTLALRDLRSLDAFLALLYLARESEMIGAERHHFLPAMCALDILPYVLH